MFWFEKETDDGLEVLDVVTFDAPGPEEAVALSGCIADADGVDVELHGLARHVDNNQWSLLRLWRADREQRAWVELDPAGFVVQPASGSCELGSGDGLLP